MKIARLNLQNTESLLKDCASIQVKQQKLINQYKENLDEANLKLEKVQLNNLRKKKNSKRNSMNSISKCRNCYLIKMRKSVH